MPSTPHASSLATLKLAQKTLEHTTEVPHHVVVGHPINPIARSPCRTPARSSVTCTKPVSVWISRSSKRSPAAARSRASFSSVAAPVSERIESGCVADPGLQVRVDADDLRVLRREREHLRPAAADDDRRVRLLHRLGLTVERVDLVVLAVERERAVGHQALEHGERLVEPRDAHAGRSRAGTRPARSPRSSTPRRRRARAGRRTAGRSVAASFASTTGCL